jgi:undecaprenyl-diphosphatase
VDFLDALILGILQGITEFLPVSSSGHLVLGQKLLGINVPGNAFEVILHIGTLMSILVVFWPDIHRLLNEIKDVHVRTYIFTLVLGTTPAIIVGLSLKGQFALMFDNVHSVALALIVTGIILIFSKWFLNKKSDLTLVKGFGIGLAQALAIIPGISRSGATICTGLMMGLSTEEAARFSFLLAIPAIAGAGLLTAIDIDKISLGMDVMAVGLLSSFLVGWVALKWLLNLLKTGKFHWFGVYCLLLGIIAAWI